MNPPAPVTKTLTELLNVFSPISCVRSKDPHYSRTHLLELLLKVRDYHRESQGLSITNTNTLTLPHESAIVSNTFWHETWALGLLAGLPTVEQPSLHQQEDGSSGL